MRFSLRAIARDFEDGLRVAVGLRNTEFLVCARREVAEGTAEDNIDVLDLRTSPPSAASIDDLPPAVRAQIG